jgi:hypothetical protein
MQVEFSNFTHTQERRAIPESCPAELRAKIERARNPVAAQPDTEGWELLKKGFAALSEQ